MEHPWLDFWNKFGETFGISAAFCFGGAAFLLWVSTEAYSPKRGLTVILGGQLLNSAIIAFTHGYLALSIFVAPIVGLFSGLTSVPLLMAIISLSQEKAGDWVAAMLKRFTGA